MSKRLEPNELVGLKITKIELITKCIKPKWDMPDQIVIELNNGSSIIIEANSIQSNKYGDIPCMCVRVEG